MYLGEETPPRYWPPYPVCWTRWPHNWSQTSLLSDPAVKVMFLSVAPDMSGVHLACQAGGPSAPAVNALVPNNCSACPPTRAARAHPRTRASVNHTTPYVS